MSEGISIREGLALASALFLILGALINDWRKKPVDALKSASTGDAARANALERARHYLRLRGSRDLAARALFLAGLLALVAAVILYIGAARG